MAEANAGTRVIAGLKPLILLVGVAAAIAAGAKGVAGIDNGFAKLLKQGIDSVNSTQAKATDLQTKFERGVPGVELPQVMLEMQKANVSFRAAAEVRNKFVEAYREIMNMPL